MTRNRQGVGGAGRGRHTVEAATPARIARFLKVQVGLAFVAGSFFLATPAQAGPANEAPPVATAEQGARASVAEDHRFLGNATSRQGLPFARPDLAMLVLGGALVTLVAAGAPLLLQAQRSSPPAFASAVSASEPLRPAGAQGNTAHAPA